MGLVYTLFDKFQKAVENRQQWCGTCFSPLLQAAKIHSDGSDLGGWGRGVVILHMDAAMDSKKCFLFPGSDVNEVSSSSEQLQ